jgi:glutathione S-transferase
MLGAVRLEARREAAAGVATIAERHGRPSLASGTEQESAHVKRQGWAVSARSVDGAAVRRREPCRIPARRFDEGTRSRPALGAAITKGTTMTRSTITISAFKGVPDFARGQVRDLRVRWALEEAGLPYGTRLLAQGDQDAPDYRARQPFGQVPVLEEDGFVLFETGAIVLYLGERSETLLPAEPQARARATQWLVAALNSIEPFVMNVAMIDLFYANEEWAKLRRPGAVEFARKRLAALSAALGAKPYLDGDRFTAGDLMMTTVLRILHYTDLVTSDRRLAAYVERCTARPAFTRALQAQLGDFTAAA